MRRDVGRKQKIRGSGVVFRFRAKIIERSRQGDGVWADMTVLQRVWFPPVITPAPVAPEDDDSTLWAVRAALIAASAIVCVGMLHRLIHPSNVPSNVPSGIVECSIEWSVE